jgi:hypothetical protein
VILSFVLVGMENSDAGRLCGVTCESIGADYFAYAMADVWGKKILPADEFGIEGEAFADEEAARFGFGLQAGDLGPGGFGIDEIFGHGRDAAPIIDAGFE